jgi:hypothetical protein
MGDSVKCVNLEGFGLLTWMQVGDPQNSWVLYPIPDVQLRGYTARLAALRHTKFVGI